MLVQPGLVAASFGPRPVEAKVADVEQRADPFARR